MTFTESMDFCFRTSMPLLFLALTVLGISLAASSTTKSTGWSNWGTNATELAVDYTKNDLLLGSQDPFFWFLGPMFGLLSASFCLMVNYATLVVVCLLQMPLRLLSFRPKWRRHDPTK